MTTNHQHRLHPHAVSATGKRLPVDKDEQTSPLSRLIRWKKPGEVVLDAIVRARIFDDLRGELGDLLFRVWCFTRRWRQEEGFASTHVISARHQRQFCRHPHVLASFPLYNSEEVLACWEQIKRKSARKSAAFRAGRYSAAYRLNARAKNPERCSNVVLTDDARPVASWRSREADR